MAFEVDTIHVNKSEKDKYCVISLICGNQKIQNKWINTTKTDP